ncbi:LysR family transcriptional regulator [Pendulispora albinea]|uniref:LysR substrate-binding domain-containing protein n=1 Tax=Pendulispora albinea TaxID=2741071 RepID=A0ABZ2M7A2_9BACT
MKVYDLNHARALHHLLEEAHVARAARRLGITPAAASNALHRLRVDFEDPLLVRSGRALVRTPRAEKLRAPAREMMAAAERLFMQGRPFDPATAAWDFLLTTSDRVAELLLPTLDRFLRERAPRARLSVRTTMVDIGSFLRDRGGVAVVDGRSLLRDGGGVAAVPELRKDPDLRSEPLFDEDLVCVLRRRHPFAGRLSLARFAALEHVLVAPLGSTPRGVIDTLLEKRGLSRKVTRVVMAFSLVLPLVAKSDRVAVLPRTLAEAHARSFGLELHPVPLPIPRAEMMLAWHLANEQDPKHVWARDLLRHAVRELGLSATCPPPARTSRGR